MYVHTRLDMNTVLTTHTYICMHAFSQVRIYFHAFTLDQHSLGFQAWDTGVHRLNSHYIYGLRLATVEMEYDYVATLEDDLIPAPDYLTYHKDMARIAEYDHDVLAVLAYPNGPWHDCNAIADKLLQRGDCRGEDHTAVYKSSFFAGWGAGMPLRALAEYMPVWNYSGIYDGIINALVTDTHYTLAPCRPRVRLVANQGVHGQSEVRWDAALSVDKEPPRGVAAYRIIQGGEFTFTMVNGTCVSTADGEIMAGCAVRDCAGMESSYAGVVRVCDVLGMEERVRDYKDVLLPAVHASGLVESDMCEDSVQQQARAEKHGGTLGRSHGRNKREIGDVPEVEVYGARQTAEHVHLEANAGKKEYVVWSSDFHTGPIASLKKVCVRASDGLLVVCDIFTL